MYSCTYFVYLVFNVVIIWCWRQWSAELGVIFLYKCRSKLVGERIRASSTSWMTELSFADDAAVVASTRQYLIKATVELNSVVTACGLTISISKTKFLAVGSYYVVQSDLDPIVVGSDFITFVASFCYVGSLMESHGGVQLELNSRISRAASVFGALKRSVFSDHMLSTYNHKVLGIPSCGAGCFVVCCGSLACEAEGSTRFREFHHH